MDGLCHFINHSIKAKPKKANQTFSSIKYTHKYFMTVQTISLHLKWAQFDSLYLHFTSALLWVSGKRSFLTTRFYDHLMMGSKQIKYGLSPHWLHWQLLLISTGRDCLTIMNWKQLSLEVIGVPVVGGRHCEEHKIYNIAKIMSLKRMFTHLFYSQQIHKSQR